MEAWFREAFQFRRDDGGIGWHGRQERIFDRMQDSPYIEIDPRNDAYWKSDGSYRWPGWPLPNVWLGTSVEDQRAADERIPHLLATPSAMRFLSCEPLLGPVDLERPPAGSRPYPGSGIYPPWYVQQLDWVIAGGESGPNYRPMDPSWLTSLVEQCRAAGVAIYVKQDSGLYPGKQGRIPDDLWIHEFPEPRPAGVAGGG
jgi:hypothetical protein